MKFFIDFEINFRINNRISKIRGVEVLKPRTKPYQIKQTESKSAQEIEEK